MEKSSFLSPEQDRAGLGMHIVVDLITTAGDERLIFDLVPDDQADFSKGFLGAGTALGQAITGSLAGALIDYRMGDVQKVFIVSVSPTDKIPPGDIKKRREGVIRSAVEESERISAMMFASSFSGKWGDYDPAGFVRDEEES